MHNLKMCRVSYDIIMHALSSHPNSITVDLSVYALLCKTLPLSTKPEVCNLIIAFRMGKLKYCGNSPFLIKCMMQRATVQKLCNTKIASMQVSLL